jgi:hypothetical protein
MYVEDLITVTGKFGKIQNDTIKAGDYELDNFWNLEKGEFRVGNNREYEDPNHNGNDNQLAEYLHYVPDVGFFQKIKNFVVSAVSSVLWGTFRVLRTGQDKAAKPTFETNPGSGPKHESSEFRGAFRVKKSTQGDTNGETVIFEVVNNDTDAGPQPGRASIPGALSLGRRTYGYPIHTTTIPAQSAATTYYIKIGTFTYTLEAKLVIKEAGNAITGSFLIDLLGSQPSTERITVRYNKHVVDYGIKGFLLAAPEGTLWSAPIELWLKVVAATSQGSQFVVHLADLIAGTFTPAEANYQTAAPSNIVQTLNITAVGGIATSGKAQANDMAVTGTAASTSPTTGALTVAGGAGISGALNVGGASKISDTTESTSKDTGALVVEGGVGIEKGLNVGGAAKILSTANSTSKDTGAVVVEGGVGIEKNLNVGGDISGNGKGYMPIGSVYTQYPGQSAPGDLFVGTWTNISSQYAGLFFRAEGGRANTFGGDSQSDSLKSHNHTYSDIPFSIRTTNDNISGNYYVFQASWQNTRITGDTGGEETRPVNTTIKVWKRTA